MQALRRRHQNAQRQVARRQTKHNARVASQLLRQTQLKHRYRNDIRRHNVSIDRTERWEDWFLGPLKTGGEEGAGRMGDGAGGLLKRKSLPPDLKFYGREAQLLKRRRLEEEAKKAKRQRLLLNIPSRKARVIGPQDTIVASQPPFPTLLLRASFYFIMSVTVVGHICRRTLSKRQLSRHL